MRIPLALLMALLVGSCAASPSSSAPSGGAGAKPTGSAVSPPGVQGSQASPSPATTVSPSPVVSPPLTLDRTIALSLNLDCRLPSRLVGDNGAAEGLPGFLNLSTGHFVSDRDSQVLGSTGSLRTVASPSLRGWDGLSYSWSAHRWIPAPPTEIAPDGLHYAYPETSPGAPVLLHVVDLAGGTDRVVTTDQPWKVLDYRADAIYVSKARYFSEGWSGVWRMDPSTGSVNQLLAAEVATTLTLGGNAGWGPAALGSTAVKRFDLLTGAETLWFSRPDPVVGFVGMDAAGGAIVGWHDMAKGSDEIWLLTSPGQGRLLYSGREQFGFNPILDANGVWLQGLHSLWLLRANGSLVQVASTQLQPLGGCHP